MFILNALIFAIQITLPSILLLAFGWFLRQKKQINEQFCHQASGLMFNWALPTLLFFSIIENDSHPTQHLKLIACGAFLALILFFATEFLCRYFVPEKRQRGIVVQGIYRGNTAIIGLAFSANAYGAQGLAIAAMYIGVLTILYNILAVITLSRSLNVNNGFKLKDFLWQIIKNPLIIGILLAFLFKNMAWHLPDVLSHSGHYLAQVALPLSLLCIGATFEWRSLFHIRGLPLSVSLVRLLVSPFLAIVIGLSVGLDTTSFGVLLLMNATPVATAAYVMVKAMGGDDVLMANIIGISTFFSMLTAAFWTGLARALGWM